MDRLLIALDSDLFAQILANTFQNEYDVRICCDGCEALKLLGSFRPQALIIGLCLPRKDCLTVLSQSDHIPRVILGIANHRDPYSFCAAQRLGVGHILICPTADSVAVALGQLRIPQQKGASDPAGQTALLLHSLGFGANMAGFPMLCIGIPLLAEDPSRRFSKDLYACIAAQFNCSESSVEASIRRAIGSAWKKRDPSVWKKYFAANPDGVIPCPNNSLFMKTLAQHIRRG